MNSSAWEKFQGATLSLTRSGTLKDRLTDACLNHLSRIHESELPRELRDEFRSIYGALTRRPPATRDDDSFRATIRKMSRDEAEEAAAGVVLIFSALQRGYKEAAVRPVVAQLVPLQRVAEG